MVAVGFFVFRLFLADVGVGLEVYGHLELTGIWPRRERAATP